MDVSLLRLNRFSHTAVRLLRRLLGDTIREQHGQQLFDHIEETRRRSVGQHRDGTRDPLLAGLLRDLPLNEALSLIHSFAIFSQLANIADDHLARCEAQASEFIGGQLRPWTGLKVKRASPC
jgi:phosphoenolpyruvate carboxylase